MKHTQTERERVGLRGRAHKGKRGRVGLSDEKKKNKNKEGEQMGEMFSHHQKRPESSGWRGLAK